MPQASVEKTVALASLVQAMHDAAEKYKTSRSEAVAILEPALARFEADAVVIGDPAIDAEAAFWAKLLSLMEMDAPQGDFYGDDN
jgi:Ca-activated chloride channel homolog